MTRDSLLIARRSIRAAVTSYRQALIGASPDVAARVRGILEALERIDSGETSMALYDDRAWRERSEVAP